MAAVDLTGAMLATRHGSQISSDKIGPNVVTKERWESGTSGGEYSAEDVNMACAGIEISNF